MKLREKKLACTESIKVLIKKFIFKSESLAENWIFYLRQYEIKKIKILKNFYLTFLR